MKCCKIKVHLWEVFAIFGIDYLKKHFTHYQRYIIVAVLSMFIPFYMCGAVLVFLTIRLLWKGEILQAYQKNAKSQFILFFCGLICIVSLLYQNYIGALCSLGFLVILSFILYYRVLITKELFEFITNLIIVLSVFAALYGLMEYINILNRLEFDIGLYIFNVPKDRINSVFFNANYYAMMIEFFVCITFYKILNIKNFKLEYRKFFYYCGVILLNLFLLVLTACRTAWPALAAGILVMLIIDKHYKTCSSLFGVILAACGYFVVNPSKFPRVHNIVSYFFKRQDIWKVAIANIKTHPLFGEGPMTYMHIYAKYNGHPTQHAHNVILDPLLCFGIVGIGTICPYIFDNIKRLYRLWKLNIDRPLVALIVSFTVMVLVHGMMDYTIFFVQTGFLYLLIASSFDIYQESLDD